MSVQAISGAMLQQPIQPTARNNSPQTAQGTAGQKVKKGGGHHHHSKPRPTGSTQTTPATGGTSATQIASAVTGAAYSQSATGAAKSSGSIIDLFA